MQSTPLQRLTTQTKYYELGIIMSELLNYVNQDDLKISEDLYYDGYRIGPNENHPIVVVDNVLANPEGFWKNVVQKQPLERNKPKDQDVVFPGFSSTIGFEMLEFRRMVSHFVNEYTDFEINDPDNLNISNQLNVMFSDVQTERISVQPHIDPAMFAYVLYLNAPQDCHGGTSFFNHEHTGETNMEHVDKTFRRSEQYWNYKEWLYDFHREKRNDLVELDTKNIEPVYEEYHHIDMKFNRLVLYPSYLWHTAIIKPGMYKDFPRVCLAGFIHWDYFIGGSGGPNA